MEAAVVAENVAKSYGDTVALRGVSLSVEPGRVYGLIGPNGAGKTTLVRALTGTTEPDEGTARVLGDSPTSIDRNRLGVLPQSFSPPDRLSARELLSYYAGLYDEARDPGEVLAAVGLVDAGDTWYENLSGGQQRRVCVGAALVNDPDVLFLDEPTTGIDPAGRRTVWGLIEDLAAAGTTVFLTTHDMAEAEHLADRVGLLADGELVAAGSPDALVAEHGGESRLTIETEADPDAVTEAIGDLEHPHERREGRVVVAGVAPAEIGSVIDALEAGDVPYTALEWTEPDLEDVYLSLAGETESVRTDRPGRSIGAGRRTGPIESGDATGEGRSADAQGAVEPGGEGAVESGGEGTR